MRTPILFLVFNRPDTTARVFEAIRAQRPPRLYVAADGPRASRPEEAQRCDEVRRIATAVDWPCEVHTLLRDHNLGCRGAVSSGVSWFFEQEPEGVVLEDDCLPDASFFGYCEELLQRYRDDPRVMCISGVNFIARHWAPEADYYFSRYSHIWGWASWRRAWQHYDVDMASWHRPGAAALLDELFPTNREARRHWKRTFDQVASGQIDTWDYQWTYACMKQGGLSCLPAVNLISNIGFGAAATHTVNPESKMANLPTGAVPSPLRHPSAVEAVASADAWTTRHVFDIDDSLSNAERWRRRLAAKLQRMSLARHG